MPFTIRVLVTTLLPAMLLVNWEPVYSQQPKLLSDAELFSEPTRIIHQWRGEAAGDQFGWTARDFSKTPTDFQSAFAKHRAAWEDSIEFLESFDELRGEMHELFAQIKTNPESKSKLEKIEKAIFDTWSEIEQSASKHK